MTQKSPFALLKPYIIIALFSFILIYCNQSIALLGFGRAAAWICLCFPSFLISELLVIAFLSVIYSITGSFAVSSCLLSLVFLFLTIANYLKEIINGLPLMVSDIGMLGETGELFAFISPNIKIDYHIFIATAIIILAIVFLSLTLRGARLFTRLRFAAGWFCLTLVIFVYFLPVSERVGGIIQISDEKGIFLSVFEMSKAFSKSVYAAEGDAVESIDFFETYTDPEVDDYDSDEKVAEILHEEDDESVIPNVVVFMSESFFDITNFKNVEYSKDPLANFRSLRQNFPGGKFLSSAYAGGTGYVEMGIFTGIPLSFLNPGDTLATLPDESVYEDLPSIAKEFKNNGYYTSYIHSYNDGLYNRSTTIPAMGFDQIFYSKDFPEETEKKGGYISDKELVNKVISEFESNKDKGPQFIYALSMQNHQPFYEGKYEESYDISCMSDVLDEHTKGIFDSLLYGIYDADASLGYMVNYFESCEEPVLVIFLGDHLPGLSIDAENTMYTILGYSSSPNSKTWDTDELKKMLSTDYVVWNNYGAEIDAPEEISSSAIGVRLLSWANVQKSKYFKIAETFAKEVLVYRDRIFVTVDGTAYAFPSESYERIIEAFSTIVRSIIYNGYRFTDD